MPAETPTAAELARQLADALDAAGLPYAVGGALALAYYAPPRATVDVDLNVFVAPEADLEGVVSALASAGFIPDEGPAALRRRAMRDGQFRGHACGMRVDVFVPAIDYYAELETRRREVELLGRPAWVLGPEDLVILKMMFFRRKDLADVEALLRDQQGAVDRRLIRRRLTDLVGSDDERLRELDAIVRDVERGQP